MSNKQDRQGVRTPADVERKYLLTLEKSFAEVLGIATDARQYAVETSERLSNEVARLDVAITEMEDKIVLLVADTYATNESVESKITLSRGEILSSVEGKYETKTNVATLTQRVDEQGASITQQATYITDNTNNIASIQSTVDEQGSKIGLIVDNNGIKAGILIEAINGCTTATLKASKIDFNTDEFRIIDSSDNLIFLAGKRQVKMGAWSVKGSGLYAGTSLLGNPKSISLRADSIAFVEREVEFVASWKEIATVSKLLYAYRVALCEVLGIRYVGGEWGDFNG